MEKLTVTRGLTQLKTLDKRIKKAIANGCYVTYKVGDKQEQDCNPKSDFQSVMDLIQYRDRLKSAIVKSNAETKVKIAGKKYTVAEAIEAKTSIQYRAALLDTLRRNLDSVRYNVDEINQDVQRRLDRLIEASVGSDSKNKSEIDAISKPFLQRNEAQIVDDLKIEEKIKTLDKELEDFLEEIDVALSESNAQTYIGIEV
jgi:cell division protein ZapA (FtsZ GTPase activity inhibitor)